MTTDRACPSCGVGALKLFPKYGRWRCTNEDCGDDFPIDPDAARCEAGAAGLVGIDMERLPAVVAIPLSEYAAEKDPLLCLWRICDTLELTLRLVVAIGVADVLRANNQELPAKLRATLAMEIEEPTLGGWRAMAREIAKHVPENALVPEIAQFVVDSLEPLLRGPEEPKDRSLDTSLGLLRNQLAHGGGITRSVAARLLALYAPRFVGVMRAGAWLGDIELVTPRNDGRPAVLGGPHQGLRAFRPASDVVLREVQRASQAGDAVVLVRGTRVLSLWPFAVYGLPFSSNPETLPACTEVPQVYSRRGLIRIQLTPVGSLEFAQSEATDEALRVFETLFRREETAPTRRWRVAGWDTSLRRDSGKLVGRAAEIGALRKVIDETIAGVLWLTGPAGIGKSSLMARIACELIDDAKAGEIILPFRFKVGDPRCSQAVFVDFVIERLRAAMGVTAEGDERGSGKKPLDELRELLCAVRGRVVFLLDGLDEIAASDLDFASKVPLGLAGPNVVWVCAGRPERGLTEAFSPGRCRHVFDAGVPRMSTNDIREMLMRRLDFLAKELARSDRDAGTQVTNPFVAAVEKYAEGLPIYIEYVIGDICSRRIQVFDDRARLPPSLAAYHEELLKRCQAGSLQMVLTPLVSLLAVAHEPLTESSLHALLVQWLRISTGPDGRSLLHNGLGAVQSMLRHESTPDGEQGYSLFHHSLRAHMETSDSSREAVAIARRVIGDAALAWEAMGKTAVEAYLFRHGIAHLLEQKRGDDTCALFTNFGYLMARLDALGSDGGREVVRDLKRVEDAGFRAMEFKRFAQFLRHHAHLMARGAGTALLQAAIAEADDSPITQAAEAWVARHPQLKAWFRRGFRPSEVERSACLMTLDAHAGPVRALALHPDGRHAITGDQSGRVEVWDLDTGASNRTFKAHEERVSSLAIQSDGRGLVSGSWDGTVKVWDVATGTCLHTLTYADATALRYRRAVLSVAIHPDGRRIVVGRADNTLALWEPQTCDPVETFALEYQTLAMAILPNGRHAVLAGGRHGHKPGWSSVFDFAPLTIWDLENDRCHATWKGHLSDIHGVALHPDGQRAISIGEDRNIRVWNLETGKCVQTLDGHPYEGKSLAIHPDGQRVVSGGSNGRIDVWDLASGIPTLTLSGHSAEVTAVAIHKDGQRLVSAGGDAKVMIWDINACCERRRDKHELGVNALAIDSQARRVVSAGSDGTLKVWSLETGACLRTLRGHDGRVNTVAVFSDGRRAVSGGRDQTVKVWDLTTGECLLTHGMSHDVTEIVVHPDGRRAFCGQYDASIDVVDLDTGEDLGRLQEAILWDVDDEAEPVRALAIDKDGRRLVSVSGNDTFIVWDIETGSRICQASEGSWPLALHPDGCLVSGEGAVWVGWDSESPDRQAMIQGRNFLALAVCPDGRHVVSGSRTALEIWAIDTGARVAAWEADAPVVCCVAAQDGRVVFGDRAGNLIFLDLVATASIGHFSGVTS